MTKTSTTIDGLTVDLYDPPGTPKATLLFSHGAWVGGWIWEGFAGWFSRRGYRCVCPTWRGRYTSKPVPDLGAVSIMDFVSDCLTVAGKVEPELLIGESLGGLIALKAAEVHDVRALVLMNPAPPFRVPFSPRLAAKQFKYLGDLLRNRPNKPTEEDYRQLILNNVGNEEAHDFYSRICAESGRALREASLGAVKVDTRRLRMPINVIIGHLDAIIPVKTHMKTAALLNADATQYPSMSHHTFSEHGWEKVAADLEVWFEPKLGTIGA